VLYLSLVIVVGDQLSKLLVKGFALPFLNFNYDGMYLGQMLPVIGDFFRITFVENPGMAFGYDPGNNFKLIISLFSFAASIGLVFYLYIIKDKSLSLRIAIALILGGAAGNLIDRTFYGVFFNYAPLFYGRVVDFIDFNFFDFSLFGRSYDRWPVFNVADAAVTIGVFILLLFYKKHQTEDEKDEQINSNEDAVIISVPKNDVDTQLSNTTVQSNNIAEVTSENINNNEQSDFGKEISD
jgi:signal peptidase II